MKCCLSWLWWYLSLPLKIREEETRRKNIFNIRPRVSRNAAGVSTLLTPGLQEMAAFPWCGIITQNGKLVNYPFNLPILYKHLILQSDPSNSILTRAGATANREEELDYVTPPSRYITIFHSTVIKFGHEQSSNA